MSRTKRNTMVSLLAVPCALLSSCSDDGGSSADDAAGGAGSSSAEVEEGTVFARLETTPSGADPDDPAIWVHPSDPSKSLVIGTDKGLGLFFYDLDGEIVDTLPGTAPNNVDLRHRVTLGGELVALGAAVDRNTDSLFLFSVDSDGKPRVLERDNEVDDFGDLYGHCFYRSADGALYAFVNAKSGAYQQYLLEETESGSIHVTKMREFSLTSQPEGCVADDDHGVLYLGEEDGGLFRIGAEPEDGDEVETIELVGEGHLTADVEGMTLYQTPGGNGYLLVSSQGSDEYVVYERRVPNDYVTTFRIGEGGGVDAATDTDGIDVVPLALNGAFSEGLFVAQDDHNEGFSRNFKFVSWGDIARSGSVELDVDTRLSPWDE